MQHGTWQTDGQEWLGSELRDNVAMACCSGEAGEAEFGFMGRM